MERISERFFEYLINSELENYLGRAYIPSQNDERTLGYDVKFNPLKKYRRLNIRAKFKVVLIQYKISTFHKMINQKPLNPDYKYIMSMNFSNDDFYKFDLHRGRVNRSYRYDFFHQHHTLLKHAHKRGNKVFYAAPQFHSFEDLLTFRDNQTIINNTVFIDLANLSKVSTKSAKHTMYFDSISKSKRILLSEPQINFDNSFGLENFLKQIKTLESFDLSEEYHIPETLRIEENVEDIIDFIYRNYYKSTSGTVIFISDEG